MKHFIFLVLGLLFFAGCSRPNAYYIEGKTTEDGWDGMTIELCKMSKGELLQENQTTIKNGKFLMEGDADSLFVGILRVPFRDGMPYLQSVVIESGKIQVLMGAETVVYGTPANALLQQFLIEKDSVIAGFNDSLTEQQKYTVFKRFIDDKVKQLDSCTALSAYIKESYAK